MATVLTASRLITANHIIEEPIITIDGPEVVGISSRQASETPKGAHEFRDGTLTPGLLDVHMHGALGHDVMEGTREALDSISRFLASRGVTGYLATTVTASLDFTLRALDGIARHAENDPAHDAARIVGIHIEGPFVSHAKRGMHPEQFILAPTVELLEKFWEASRGQIKLMTIAPELPGALETIARASELGIRPSIGHSNADAAQALKGLEAGAVSATHTYNAMRPLDHRDPGILGIVLDRDDLYAELICDGIHVAPELVRLWLKAKGPERGILITDSLQATGMPDGEFRLGETRVHVKNGRCTTDSGVLAGSVLSLDEAVRRLQKFTGADLPTAVRLASRNPARMLGLPHDFGVGTPANFNVYNAAGERTHTVLRGRIL